MLHYNTLGIDNRKENREQGAKILQTMHTYNPPGFGQLVYLHFFKIFFVILGYLFFCIKFKTPIGFKIIINKNTVEEGRMFLY